VAKELRHPEWLRRLNLFGDAVGDPRLLVGLDAGDLLAVARSSTGLDDLGEAEWPGWEETYRRQLGAIDAEARLHTLGRLLTRAEVLRILRTWLALVDLWRADARIAATPVSAPIFVVGPPRTGTSILLELLALDPALRAPLAWEALYPLPPAPGADPEADAARKLALAESEQELWGDLDPEFLTMHELASHLPCECVHFLSYDFSGPYWSMLYDTPSFMAWQLDHLDTLGRVYRLHRRMLQTFAPGGESRRWLLKSPAHLSTLPALFAEYPDAYVVHTHRDPRKFVASVASLLSVLRHMRSDHVDPTALGPAMLATYQLFLEQAITQRSSGEIPGDRIVDSHFLDLMADPVGQVRSIYERLGLDWPPAHDAVIRDYLAHKPKGKYGEHRYSATDVGITDDDVRTAFAGYVAHYAITEE
jgi:hypothetical protein